MRSVRVLLGVMAAGLAWASPGGAYTPQPMTFYEPVDLGDKTSRVVLWQTESTPCNASDRYGPDGRRGTADDLASPGDAEFILDLGCAVRAPDAAAEFIADLDSNSIPGLPAGTDLSNGYVVNLSFESGGATAVVTLQSDVWGPIVKSNVDTPGLVTVNAATVSDYVFKIDVASGDVTSFSWSGDANTVLGPATLGIGLPGALPGECDGSNCHWYSAEASAAPGASGATNWMCGTGGFLAQPNNTPGADPGSFGTCPNNNANLSPVVADDPYDPVTGTLYANARSVVLGVTPKAWAPLDGRLSEAPEPGHLLMLLAGAGTLALAGRRRRTG